MDKILRFLIIFLLTAFTSLDLTAQQPETFQEVDRQSYDLYQKGEWKELIRYSNEAFREGFDYYYLRIRAGTACFETKRYLKAALHFKKALAFNENDFLAGEYLFGCYIEMNRSAEAYEIYKKLPPSSREKLKKSLPKLHHAEVVEAFITCNQMEKFDSLDLDGSDNLYGETDITQDGYYFNSNLSWGFKNGYGLFGAYSLVKLNKNKIAKIGDTLTVDDQYPLKQHQVYVSGNIPLGKGFSVLPAFNLVMDRYETVMPKLSPDSINYLLPVERFSENFYIGYLSVTRDFNIIQATLFTAYSNLNNKRQFQGGIQATVYPLGNLNFYLTSKLADNLNDKENHIIFDQMIGFRFTKQTWIEANATFGRMQNYHEKNAFVVYNITDEMKFKGGAKLIYLLYPNWIVTMEYLYLLREGQYFYYHSEGGAQPVPVTVNKDFSNNIFLIGFKWKF